MQESICVKGKIKVYPPPPLPCYNARMKFPILFPIKRSDFTFVTPSAFDWSERLWRHTDKAPGQGPKGKCWLWTGDKSDKGYGKLEFCVGGSRTLKPSKSKVRSCVIRAHRLSYLLHHGEIPFGLKVLHKCDMPACIRPSHLFLGTERSNFVDSVRKGRHSFVKNGKVRKEDAGKYAYDAGKHQ